MRDTAALLPATSPLGGQSSPGSGGGSGLQLGEAAAWGGVAPSSTPRNSVSPGAPLPAQAVSPPLAPSPLSPFGSGLQGTSGVSTPLTRTASSSSSSPGGTGNAVAGGTSPAAALTANAPVYDVLDIVRVMEALTIDTAAVIDTIGGTQASSLDALRAAGVPYMKCLAVKKALAESTVSVQVSTDSESVAMMTAQVIHKLTSLAMKPNSCNHCSR